nr:hypothetical protein CFP56_49994 [Quercus suber]
MRRIHKALKCIPSSCSLRTAPNCKFSFYFKILFLASSYYFFHNLEDHIQKLSQLAKMKKSPIYPKYETTAYEGDGFDSHVVDFSQFLQEARHHAREVGFHSSSLHPEENVKKRLAEEKKVKKSWKNSLLSWWKTDKKSKLQVEPEVSSYNSTPRQRLVSGPIHGSGKNNDCRPMDLFTW